MITLQMNYSLCSSLPRTINNLNKSIDWRVVFTTHLFLSPLRSSRDDVVAFVFVHHAQNAHWRLIGATKSLQQLVMLSADLLSHLTRSFDQFVLHHGRVLVVRLEVGLTVRGQAHQAGLLSLLLPCCAEVTQDLPVLGLGPGLASTGRATRFLHAAVSVQIQSAGVGHFYQEFKKRCPGDMIKQFKSTGDVAQQQCVNLLIKCVEINS